MKTNYEYQKTPRVMDLCCFCGQHVNLNLEGVTYRNGKCAHESCHDGNECNKENASDFRD